jgi:signal peptidase I
LGVRLLWQARRELLRNLSVALLSSLCLITFVAQGFRVQGKSMLPQLENGELIIVNQFIYRFRAIGRGDVVAFW